MKKIKYYIASVGTLLLLNSCDKNDPITELGETNGEFSAQLSVSFNNTKPLIGDTVIVTASSWQRDDKIEKIEFQETIVESFGILVSLENGSTIQTKDQEVSGVTFSTLVLNDTIKNKSVWNVVERDELDSYWVTASNNYVVRRNYELKRLDGRYPSNTSLLSTLSVSEFEVLKSILAYAINREDYLLLFPDAPSTHFTNAGAYALTQLGINNLKENLHVNTLLTAVKSVGKKGTYTITIQVDAVTPTGTVTTTTPRVFENNI
ncbi:hypothetical protein [Sphingobacterium sp. LRF_L2]|uniref:hypothetical protein n=1 Tax=Sphingobacterium sp. LRF_L2 TaxID=3369421 RepID=UPI003F5E83AA